jgi:phage terminase small subunit|tara:strand:+ start:1537 stop:1947 length:411 start_codon:yes stop_codon:yes gene_type:complete
MSIKNKTMKQRREEFVQHFLVTKNATEAAKRCGYSEKSSYNQGYRMMNDDEVQKMLAIELADSKERNLKDHDSIIEQLKDEALGKVSGHTAGSRVKALEILMKFYGMIDANTKLEVSMKDSWFETLDFIEKEDHLN